MNDLNQVEVGSVVILSEVLTDLKPETIMQAYSKIYVKKMYHDHTVRLLNRANHLFGEGTFIVQIPVEYELQEDEVKAEWFPDTTIGRIPELYNGLLINRHWDCREGQFVLTCVCTVKQHKPQNLTVVDEALDNINNMINKMFVKERYSD